MKVKLFGILFLLLTSCNFCDDMASYTPVNFVYTPVTSSYENFYGGSNPLHNIDSLEIKDNNGDFVYYEHWRTDGKVRIDLNKNITEIYVRYNYQLTDTFQFGYWLNRNDCDRENISQINIYRNKNLLCEKCKYEEHILIVE